MPRIYDSANDAHDFCARHFPTEVVAERRFGDVGDGPDGRGNCFAYEAEHPPYEGEHYHCKTCKTLLNDSDN